MIGLKMDNDSNPTSTCMGQPSFQTHSPPVPLHLMGATFAKPPIFHRYLPPQTDQCNSVLFSQSNKMHNELTFANDTTNAPPHSPAPTTATKQQVSTSHLDTIVAGNLNEQLRVSHPKIRSIPQRAETLCSEVHQNQSPPKQDEMDIENNYQQETITDNTEKVLSNIMPTGESSLDTEFSVGNDNDDNSSNNGNFIPADMVQTPSQPLASITPKESQSAVELSLNDENRGSNEKNTPLFKNGESGQPENSITTTADTNQFDCHSNNSGSNGDVLYVDNENDEEEDVEHNLADLRKSNTPTNQTVFPSTLYCQHCFTSLTSFANLRLHTRIAHIYTKPFLCTFPNCTELPFFTFDQAEEHIQRQHLQQQTIKDSKKFVRTYLELIYREDEELKKWLTSDKHRSLEASADLPEDNNNSNVTAGVSETAEASEEMMPSAAVAIISSSQSVQTDATQNEEEHFQMDALSAVDDTFAAEAAATTFTAISDIVSTSRLQGPSSSSATNQDQKVQGKKLKSLSAVQNTTSAFMNNNNAASDSASIASPYNSGQNTCSTSKLKRLVEQSQKTPVKKLKSILTSSSINASSSSISDRVVIAVCESTEKHLKHYISKFFFVCQRPACEQKCEALSCLIKHDRIHRGEDAKLFHCCYNENNRCTYTTPFKSNMTSHVKSQHANLVQPEHLIGTDKEKLKAENELWAEAQTRAVFLFSDKTKAKFSCTFEMQAKNCWPKFYNYFCREPNCKCDKQLAFGNLRMLAKHFEKYSELKEKSNH